MALASIAAKRQRNGYAVTRGSRFKLKPTSPSEHDVSQPDHRKAADGVTWRWTVRRKELLDRGLCQDCGKNPRRNKISPVCEQCAKARFAYGKERHKQYKDSGICVSCKHRETRSGKTMCGTCAAAAVERSRQKRKRIKSFLINRFGGKCAVCGEIDHRVLTFDHINGDGHVHRRALNAPPTKASGGAVFYAKLYRSILLGEFQVTPIQLLCFNCHCKKDLCPWWLKDS